MKIETMTTQRDAAAMMDDTVMNRLYVRTLMPSSLRLYVGYTLSYTTHGLRFKDHVPA
ncbi:hypothetical protein SAMN04515673_11347 [Poseidonocella sedimentorum]|uniref:Uncharacterized protein n=1 Tax=Poseidonocella sedimentorum TaxID=871652 RepID=A0A1I6EK86_9RHOB|nr:hypothetical protein SAMN04515673_11347 [Poseidonocella sedimentorum]